MTTSSRLLLALLLLNTSSVFAQELPIKATRTISFTTDEGSYMDVDVSPDSRTILFNLLGDLYSVPVAGGQAKQLTRGLAMNSRPVWSPDGTKIAYLSDYSGALHLNVRDIPGKYHVVLGSGDPQVHSTATPVWTPDGNFISIGDSSLYSLSGGKIFLAAGLKNIIGFSHDGLLAYYINALKLYQYNLKAKIAIQLSPPDKKILAPVLSPDARWLAYITDSNSRKCLAVSDLQNNIQRIIIPALYIKHPYSNTFYYPHYSFSSDSKTLFIGYGGKIHRIDIQSGLNRIVPFYANVNADLGPYDYHYFAVTHDSLKTKYTRSANTSPDGKKLVFSALDKIYLMELPNGAPHAAAPQSIAQFQPVFSPDGRWIAYVSWCDTAGGSLWRVPIAGGQPEKLTNVPGQYQRPAWSPDGALIAVVKAAPVLGDRDDPGLGQLELISLNGGDTRVIDDSVPLWNQLAFSPDGKKIIYEPRATYAVGIHPVLITKNLTGGDSTILSTAVTPPAIFSLNFNLQKTISPDDRFIVYSMGEDLYLTPICKLAQPVELYNAKKQLPVIKFAQGMDPFWEKAGKILSWTYGNKFYEIDPDKILQAAQENQTRKSVDNSILTANIEPQRVVPLNISVPSSYAHGIIAFTNVRILTMRGNSIIDRGTILIKDGRFTALGSVNQVVIPRDAKIIDLPGTTIIPGLVDLHLHMRLSPDVFPQQSWMYLANLAYGVTTARDPSSSFDSFGYGELLRSGQMLGPRLFSVGRAVRLISEGITQIDDLQDAGLIVGKRATLGATTVKQYNLPTRIQRQWLLIASNQAGLNMTNEGDYDPMIDLAMMKDGSTGIEHNPFWADTEKDITYFIAHSGTFLTPTLQVRYGEELARYNSNHSYWNAHDPKLSRFTPQENLMVISNSQVHDTTNTCFLCPSIVNAYFLHAGGRICLGSHGEDQGIGAHNELWALQMGGMTNMEALQCATIRGAEALGVQKDLGSIEVGKIADLIVLNKNPLDDIHNSREIRYVMKDGILYDGETLDEIWPEQKKCPDWHLHETLKEPATDSHN